LVAHGPGHLLVQLRTVFQATETVVTKSNRTSILNSRRKVPVFLAIRKLKVFLSLGGPEQYAS
jgi:hypothetical protein